MDKTIYQSRKEESKRQWKEVKKQYKKTRSPLKKRVGKVLNRAKNKIVKRFHYISYTNREDINGLNVKFDYVVNSLKATLNTTDEIRKKTIEDIVENIDDL